MSLKKCDTLRFFGNLSKSQDGTGTFVLRREAEFFGRSFTGHSGMSTTVGGLSKSPRTFRVGEIDVFL